MIYTGAASVKSYNTFTQEDAVTASCPPTRVVGSTAKVCSLGSRLHDNTVPVGTHGKLMQFS